MKKTTVSAIAAALGTGYLLVTILGAVMLWPEISPDHYAVLALSLACVGSLFYIAARPGVVDGESPDE